MIKKWWHDKVVYQIYPQSFKDDNNDGYGDIKGIISKLDYLKDLGVDILWLTPFFLSPMVDNGYDVADYKKINPKYGTMEDIDTLISELNKREMYLMIDIVANHTSDKHPWFIESRKNKNNPYRDYYIWRKTPPYDYHCGFGDSVWKYDETTGEYYFHEFAEEQPDLNWENPLVLDEIAECINFWMKKGVKGIRFDVIHLIGKEIDNNIHGYGPTLHQKVHDLYKKSYGKYDIVTVGEAWGDLEKAIDFTKPENEELDMVFQFEHTSYTNDPQKQGKFSPKPINMRDIRDILIKYQLGLNEVSWNALFVENHDLGRCINRFGSLKYYEKSAKMIPMMMYFQKGTPYIYQGQEIGMTNIHMDGLEDYRDVEIINSYKYYVEKNHELTKEEFLKACYQEGRDNNRTPIQWDGSLNAGWNEGAEPWIKINPNYKMINVKDELKDENSILNFYKRLFAIRKSNLYKDLFVYGKFIPQEFNDDDIFAYIRENDHKKVMIICNMKEKNKTLHLNDIIKKLILSNYHDLLLKDNELCLRAYEAILVEL